MHSLAPDRVEVDERLALRLHADASVYVRRLEQSVYSPLCGLLTGMGFITRGRHDARVHVASGELTGVHLLCGNDIPPRPGSHHLGGFGIVPFEGQVKLLGEAVERYAGYSWAVAHASRVRFCSYQELIKASEPTLPASAFRPFTARQFEQPEFPFVPFDPEQVIGWLPVPSLAGPASRCWVPAQQFLLGYVLGPTERRFWPAVTTGTAVHPDPDQALRAALEELTQIDAAIGHWHGRFDSVRIRRDRRTAALDRLIDQSMWQEAPRPEFHLLPSPDLPGFAVVCLLRAPGTAMPRVVCGLGSGTGLVRSMYRAFLEAIGVQRLANWVLIEHAIADREEGESGSPLPFYDLDSNVGYYASAAGAALVEDRFGTAADADATDLMPDTVAGPRDTVRSITSAFTDSGKRLFWTDLTTRDIRSAGLTAVRAWSPDTIMLPLPSAPPAAHPRFDDYGGFARQDAHPYP